ncbi:SAM dependent methyltransferase [Cyanobium sp. PCC 7001]|nr:SAM dependent methyltransferase [Cyanobium sp. PCC 7001]
MRCGFDQGAAAYDDHARLQRAVAWRLAHQVRALALPPGPMADLGAGTGLVGRSLAQQGWPQRLRQVDASAALLARNPLSESHGSLLWDLNQGLPDGLAGAALLSSSFALQWLDDPLLQLERWCQGLMVGGWLVLAVPTARSFPEWRTAASYAGVPCSGLPLPAARALESVARRDLRLERCDRLRFSLPCPDGGTFLGQLKAIGAGTSPTAPLGPMQLRRLLQHWPATGTVTWEVLLLSGQRAP